ncbi:hypothetical protein HQR03_01370 [Psychrobacter okhotskensis]|uniref:hypothetical protein n=1 Tax=Psychrobacter okhotskensis TaxID=212403 RepID=UPI001C26C576|nr:hypothetical protein [Psychrobacter okhotskensis]NRD69192.1 hypothetical protein [Psychrobacter okhotskensis]
MITLSVFQQQLASIAALPAAYGKSTDGQEQHLRNWVALMPSQTEAQQTEQLEKVLMELRVADVDDQQRFTLITIVLEAADRLIAALRQYYIYEAGALSDAQLAHVAQVKSLYYLIVLTYDGVIRREIALLDQQKPPASSGWQRHFTGEKSSPVRLAIAIYQTLLMYQKLLIEDALCYQKPPSYVWAAINRLYYLAHQRHAATLDLSSHVVTNRADTIHRLYCQICLHSLLNVRGMRRPNMLLVQRSLPEWAEPIVATIEPQTETRVFVNLHSDSPPTYLTAHSDINPYENQYDCLFIELAPVVTYLKARRQALMNEGSAGVECCLLDRMAMALTYRYIQPQLTVPTKYSPKQNATMVTGFNDIHYHASHAQGLISLIGTKELPDAQRPRYDTVPKKQTTNGLLSVETFDSKDALSHFRTLRLIINPEDISAVTEDKVVTPSTATITTMSKVGSEASSMVAVMDSNTTNADIHPSNTAPPPLQMMSLFLLCRSETKTAADWSMGVVRWLNLDTRNPEVEWQVLGHKLISCGLRLEDRGSRSQHFVPAFMIAGDDQLQTTCSLVVPISHFQTSDRVIMRLNNKQKSLRLLNPLLVTDEFSQYEVVQL